MTLSYIYFGWLSEKEKCEKNGLHCPALMLSSSQRTEQSPPWAVFTIFTLLNYRQSNFFCISNWEMISSILERGALFRRDTRGPKDGSVPMWRERKSRMIKIICVQICCWHDLQASRDGCKTANWIWKVMFQSRGERIFRYSNIIWKVEAKY